QPPSDLFTKRKRGGSGRPARAAGKYSQANRVGGGKRPAKLSRRGAKLMYQLVRVVWASTNGSGILVNCRTQLPSTSLASTRSPPSSGYFLPGRHKAWPCCTRQPGPDMVNRCFSLAVRQPAPSTALASQTTTATVILGQ